MPIEEDIIEKIKRFAFNKKLPEFIDRAKYLEGRLKEGEGLLVRKGWLKTRGPTCWNPCIIYLELHKPEGKPKRKRVVTIHCSGEELTYNVDLFKDYKPLSKSQRA